MSTPIKYCWFVSAAENQESFERLHRIMQENMEWGAYTMLPCNHVPPCRKLTDQEGNDLMERLNQPMDTQ